MRRLARRCISDISRPIAVDRYRSLKPVDLSGDKRTSRSRDSNITYLQQSGDCVFRDLISGNRVSRLFFEEKRISVDYSIKSIERCRKPTLAVVIATVVTPRYARARTVRTQPHIDMTQDRLQCHTSKNKTQTSASSSS